MTVDRSPEYFRLRESQERAMAEKAASDEARSIHLALADKYRALAKKGALICGEEPR